VRRWQAVLWDLDGTLLDTAPDLIAAVHELCRRHGRAPLSFARLRPLASQGARGLLREAFGVEPQQPEYEALRAEFLALYAADIAAHTRLFPGIAQCLAGLAEQGIPWGIVTNKPGYLTDALLAALPLPVAPAVVVSGDTTARSKPDPLPLHHALAQLEAMPQRSLYLGDDRRDIAAAHAAGCIAWAAGWGYCGGDAPTSWGADAVIGRSEDLAARLFAEDIGSDGTWERRPAHLQAGRGENGNPTQELQPSDGFSGKEPCRDGAEQNLHRHDHRRQAHGQAGHPIEGGDAGPANPKPGEGRE